MKLYEHRFFIGISSIFIILLFFIATISASPITVTAKPSANNNLQYKDYTVTWENYCPMCGQEKMLIFNPKGTYEGELTCSYCDADYCAVTGKDKHGKGPRAHLSFFKPHYSTKETHSYKNDNYTNSSKDDLSNNVTMSKENNTNIFNLGNLILNGLNLATYSQFEATLLENIV